MSAKFDLEDVFGEDYLYFYSEGMTDERNQAEVAEILEFLDVPRGAAILDCPCGHGRLSNLLAAGGMVVTGMDASSLFLERARDEASSKGVNVRYVEGDMRSLPWQSPEFDAAVCWFTSFGYFNDEDNLRVLSEFRRVLRPGGKLLIETAHHDGFVRMLEPGLGLRHTNDRILDEIRFDTATGRIVITHPVGDGYMQEEVEFHSLTGRLETYRTVVRGGSTRHSRYSVRLPTPPEFNAWLAKAGFTSVSATTRKGAPLEVDSRRLVIVAS